MSTEPRPLTKEICVKVALGIEEGFQRYNVSIKPLSDMAIFIKEIRWLAENICSSPEKMTKKEINRWIYSFLRIQQARNISTIFGRLADAQIPVEKLHILQKRLDCLNQQGDSQAPDIFFELEVAGRIARQYPNWNIVFKEPDIVIEYPKGRVGLSCKRPKSERRLSDRLSEAANQGIRAGIPFFIIIDTQEILQKMQKDEQQILKPPFSKYLIHTSSQTDLESKCMGYLADLVVRYSKPIADVLSKGTGGVIFCARCVGLVDNPMSLCWCLRHQSCPNLSISGTGYALKWLVKLMEG